MGKKRIGAFALILMFMLMGLCQACADREVQREESQIKCFTAFMAVPGKEIPEDNRVMNRIAEKTGAKAKISWLDSGTAEKRVETMIESGNYPDFIDGSDGTGLLIENKALIPLDPYFDQYPNIRDYLPQEEWNKLRQTDGHIYVIPQFGVVQGEDMRVQHADQAFWIQKRVLVWAGYPKIRTLDEYFDLIEAWLEANPTAEDGQKNIGFEILCDDWRYFCLENPPMFLAGYPNEGCAVVDPETKQASIYDDLPEAKQYYRRLCREYERGVLDPEAFTMSYSQYLGKIASGCVLGMADQYWQFQGAELALKENGMNDRTYVPLGITASRNIQDAYRNKSVPGIGRGLGITVGCQDVEGALQFLNDLLEPEIQILRFWGEEGIDYEVGEDGMFYRTESQRTQASDSRWYQKNRCDYTYFPHFEGMLKDGINAVIPDEQPGEYYATLTEEDRAILDAYGYEKWTDFLSPPQDTEPWFPLYSALDTWEEDTAFGQARTAMEQVKREWLPMVIMAGTDRFEEVWENYRKDYEERVDVRAYEEELTGEVRRRIAAASGRTQTF